MGGLVLGQYCNFKISILYKYADLKQLGIFFCFPEKHKIMAFSSDRIKQALIA